MGDPLQGLTCFQQKRIEVYNVPDLCVSSYRTPVAHVFQVALFIVSNHG